MAKCVAIIQKTLDQYGYDECGYFGTHTYNKYECSFGFPGLNQDPSMSSLHGTVYAVLGDDSHLWVGLNAQLGDPVAGNSYGVRLFVNDTTFTFNDSTGMATDYTAIIPSDGDQEFDVDATDASGSAAPSWASGYNANTVSGWTGKSYTDRGWLVLNIRASKLSVGDTIPEGSEAVTGGNTTTKSGYFDCGAISNYTVDESTGKGGFYLAGTGTYTVTNPGWPTPVYIEFDDFIILKEYYPFAIYQSSAWQSANRSSGNTKIYQSSTWRDVKNIPDDSSTNSKAHYYNGSSWIVCPKIGAE